MEVMKFPEKRSLFFLLAFISPLKYSTTMKLVPYFKTVKKGGFVPSSKFIQSFSEHVHIEAILNMRMFISYNNTAKK